MPSQVSSYSHPFSRHTSTEGFVRFNIWQSTNQTKELIKMQNQRTLMPHIKANIDRNKNMNFHNFLIQKSFLQPFGFRIYIRLWNASASTLWSRRSSTWPTRSPGEATSTSPPSAAPCTGNTGRRTSSSSDKTCLRFKVGYKIYKVFILRALCLQYLVRFYAALNLSPINSKPRSINFRINFWWRRILCT